MCGSLWDATEVYPAEQDGQYHSVVVQHALGHAVVHRLRGRGGGVAGSC